MWFEVGIVVLVMLWDFRYISQNREKSNRLPVKEGNAAEKAALKLRYMMREASPALSRRSGVIHLPET